MFFYTKDRFFMNTMNKILLTIIVATATNQTLIHTTEPNTNEPKPAEQKNSNVKGAEDVLQKTPLEKYEKQKLIKRDTALELETALKKIQEYEQEQIKNGIKEEDRLKDRVLIDLKATAIALKLANEKADADLYAAWRDAKPLTEKAYKLGNNIVFGGALITYFGLTGNAATLAKYGSLVTVVLATAFVADKAYNYFFKEEIESEDTF
jgi:hypothetical protein